MHRILVFFPFRLELSHLEKDVGVIPFILSEHYSYEASIAAYEIDWLVRERAGFKRLHTISLGRAVRFIDWRFLLFLFCNSRKFNVFQPYFLDLRTVIYGSVFKLFNPSAVLAVKSDFNPRQLDMLMKKYSKGNFIWNFLINYFIKSVDIITVETSEGVNLLRHAFPEIQKNIIYIPNGFLDASPIDNGLHKKFLGEKEKIAVVVGRIGLPFKGHRILLDAIKNLSLKDWKFFFIGPIDESFYGEIERFKSNNKELFDQVFFIGEITDRNILENYYQRSMVICHPSIETLDAVESCPMVLIEALRYGNYIITTDAVPSAIDVCDDQKYGTIIKNNNLFSLSYELQKIIDNPEQFLDGCEQRVRFALDRFSWLEIVGRFAVNISIRLKKFNA